MHFGLFNDFSQVHDRNLVADMLHNREIVRNEQVRDAEILLQLDQEMKDLGSNRHVQSRNEFVANDDSRINGKRPDDADSLSPPA